MSQTTTRPHLRSVASTGETTAFASSRLTEAERAQYANEDYRIATPCGGCQCVPAAGQEITKYRRSWWHLECAERDAAQAGPRASWMALGHDLARSPRAYNVRETRAIVGALLGMVHDPDSARYDEPDDFSDAV